jgi:peptide/nickel transport system substrate-binding protein
LAAAALPPLGRSATLLDRDGISIAYPNDVPTWDPHLRLAQNSQSLYKMVFDPALTQAPDLRVVPNLVRAWHYRDPLTLELELRDDAAFHNGDNGWILPQTFSVSP